MDHGYKSHKNPMMGQNSRPLPQTVVSNNHLALGSRILTHMELSKIGGTPSHHPFADGFSIRNYPFWGIPMYGNPQIAIILGRYNGLGNSRFGHDFRYNVNKEWKPLLLMGLYG